MLKINKHAEIINTGQASDTEQSKAQWITWRCQMDIYYSLQLSSTD